MPVLGERTWAEDQVVGAIQLALVEAGYDCRLYLDGIWEDQLIIPSRVADYKGDPYAIYIRFTGTIVQVWQATPLLSEDADLADPNSFEQIIAAVKRWRK